jgi:PAS domain S-box-containing protein
MGKRTEKTDDKPTYEELKKENAILSRHYRAVVDNSMDAILLTSPEGKVFLANQAACDLFQMTEQEMIDGGRSVIIDKKDDRLSKALEEREKTGKFVGELNFKRKDGTIFPGEISSSIYKDADRQPLTSMVIRDVTERKKMETALQKSENLLSQAEDIAQMGSWEWDCENDIAYWSDGLFKIFKRSPEEGAPRFAEQSGLYKKESYKRLSSAVNECFNSGTPYEVEVHAIRSDGEIRICISRGRAEKNPKGRIFRLLGTFTDITERKHIEYALKESEAKYRTIFENAPLGIFRSTPEGRFIEVNPALAQLLGYDSPETVIREIHNIAEQIYVRTEERREIVEEQMSSQEVKHYLNHYRRADGTEFIANLYLKTIRDEKEKELYFEGIIEDVTKLKEQETKLQQYSRQLEEAIDIKDKFFGIVAHDLRNPFIAFLKGTEMLRENVHDSDSELIHTISQELYKSSQRLYNLLENLLTWSRIQRGEMVFTPKEIDVYSLANYICTLLTPNVQQKNIELLCSIPQGTVVHADYNMLQAVFSNLATNAIKFTNKGGRISIKALDKGEEVEFSVIDNGVGISDDKLKRLFKVGEQKISTEGTSEERGTGLGLILCKEFMDKHGGRIEVESKVGKGSTFKFTLPKRKTEW